MCAYIYIYIHTHCYLIHLMSLNINLTHQMSQTWDVSEHPLDNSSNHILPLIYIYIVHI